MINFTLLAIRMFTSIYMPPIRIVPFVTFAQKMAYPHPFQRKNNDYLMLVRQESKPYPSGLICRQMKITEL